MNDIAGAVSAAPLFVPLTPAGHGHLRLTTKADYGSARGVNAIPLAITELAEAAAHYPVVFSGESPRQLVAVVGLEAQRNLFVESDGGWAPGHYVPAALRRRPLALARTGATDEFAVMIDEADRETLSESEGDLIFEDGKLGKRAQDLVNFCRDLQAASEETRRFVEAVEGQGLLEEKRVEFTGRNGAPGQVRGSWAIDRLRLRELPDEIVVQWHRRGWLAWVYFHLASELRWGLLGARVGRQG